MKVIKHKQLKIDDELISLCKQIQAEEKNDDEWSKFEASDILKSENYCGRYDAIEQGFWFSYQDINGKEWSFEITTGTIPEIILGKLQYLNLYEPSE